MRRLQELIFDQSFRVASCAAFWFARAGGDPATMIRTHIRSSARIAPASLALLATIGKPNDADALLQTAHLSSGRARWAAYAAAARLTSERVFPLIEAVVLGQDTGEARRAVRLLAALNHNIDTGQLMQFAERPEEFRARNLGVLPRKLVPWSTLAVMLNLAVHGERLEALEPQFQLVLARSACNWAAQPERARAIAGHSRHHCRSFAGSSTDQRERRCER